MNCKQKPEMTLRYEHTGHCDPIFHFLLSDTHFYLVSYKFKSWGTIKRQMIQRSLNIWREINQLRRQRHAPYYEVIGSVSDGPSLISSGQEAKRGLIKCYIERLKLVQQNIIICLQRLIKLNKNKLISILICAIMPDM